MRAISSSPSAIPRCAVDDRLAAMFGWFEAAPLPEILESVIEQLEAAYQERREPQPV